jgi:hypothetical protein
MSRKRRLSGGTNFLDHTYNDLEAGSQDSQEVLLSQDIDERTYDSELLESNSIADLPDPEEAKSNDDEATDSAGSQDSNVDSTPSFGRGQKGRYSPYLRWT